MPPTRGADGCLASYAAPCNAGIEGRMIKPQAAAYTVTDP